MLVVSKGFLRVIASARPQMTSSFAERSRLFGARLAQGAGLVSTGISLAELSRDWNKEVEVYGQMVRRTKFEKGAAIFCVALDGLSNVGGVKGALCGVGKVAVGMSSAIATGSHSFSRQHASNDFVEGLAGVASGGVGLLPGRSFGRVSDILTIGLRAELEGPKLMGLVAPILDEYPKGVDIFVLDDIMLSLTNKLNSIAAAQKDTLLSMSRNV